MTQGDRSRSAAPPTTLAGLALVPSAVFAQPANLVTVPPGLIQQQEAMP
jgi:hypothetical protein